MRGLIVGTGYSLKAQLDLIPKFNGLVFTCNNTPQDVRTDVWSSCDPTWHELNGKQDIPGADCWHWDKGICEAYGYKYVEGVWMVDGKAYPRDMHLTPPGDCGGLWMQDKSRISLNHCSGAQLLNLACNQYECDEVLLVGHDFHYSAPRRHYFEELSETPGEYPQQIRKTSNFDKGNGRGDLLDVYRQIAKQEGLPPIINCTPGSKLSCFPMGRLEDYLDQR